MVNRMNIDNPPAEKRKSVNAIFDTNKKNFETEKTYQKLTTTSSWNWYGLYSTRLHQVSQRDTRNILKIGAIMVEEYTHVLWNTMVTSR